MQIKHCSKIIRFKIGHNLAMVPCDEEELLSNVVAFKIAYD